VLVIASVYTFVMKKKVKAVEHLLALELIECAVGLSKMCTRGSHMGW
jgi:hypothetical protein